MLLRELPLRTSYAMSCAFVGLFVGCSPLIDANSSPTPLVTFSGIVPHIPSSDAELSNLRVALVWYPESLEHANKPAFEPACPGLTSNLAYNGFVAQELDIQPSFPARFTLNLSEPPPQSVLALLPDGTTDGGWAIGQIVLYIDANGNKVL